MSEAKFVTAREITLSRAANNPRQRASHTIKRETEPRTASALKLVSRLNKKVSSNKNKLVKAEPKGFRVEVEKMDIMKMMKQAQGLQQKLKDTQEELSRTEVTGESAGGAVKVIVDGQGRFKSIKLSPEAINPENPSSIDADTVEMLEDVITTAITQASKKATDEMETKMKSLTGGLNIPGMSGLF